MEHLTGVVLAGGQGKRMGGADKGLLPYPCPADEPLVAHALKRLAPQVGALMISANRNRDSYAAWGHPVVSDEMPEFLGPLAGIAAALRCCTTPWLVCVPCDAPRLPLNLVATLSAALCDAPPSVRAAYAVTPHDLAHPIHPVFCLIHRSGLERLQMALDQGERGVLRWLRAQGAIAVPFEDADAFTNLNRPGELAQP